MLPCLPESNARLKLIGRLVNFSQRSQMSLRSSRLAHLAIQRPDSSRLVSFRLNSTRLDLAQRLGLFYWHTNLLVGRRTEMQIQHANNKATTWTPVSVFIQTL